MRLPIDTGSVKFAAAGPSEFVLDYETRAPKLDDPQCSLAPPNSEMTKAEDVVQQLLDIQAATVRLGCSERFVRRLVHERRIPFIKLGGTRVRFLDSDLDGWISGQRIETKR